MKEGDFFTRHSIRPEEDDPESSDFEGISEKGVELARQRAVEIFEMLKESDPGTIMLLGGATDAPRTKSTQLLYGQEIKKLVDKQDVDDIIVILPEEIGSIEGFRNKIEFLVKKIKDNPDKKFVLTFPLFIREFSFRDTWADGSGKWKEYGNELLRRNDYDDERALKDWLENQGKIDSVKEGPNPKEIAKNQLVGLERLRKFVKNYIPERSLVIGSVGHSWSLDALAIYLVNNGEVTVEAFNKMNAEMIGETGMITLTRDGNGKQFLQYGKLSIPLEGE